MGMGVVRLLVPPSVDIIRPLYLFHHLLLFKLQLHLLMIDIMEELAIVVKRLLDMLLEIEMIDMTHGIVVEMIRINENILVA